MKIIAIIGSSGAIGNGFLENLLAQNDVAKIYSFSRQNLNHQDDRIINATIDLEDESSIANAAKIIEENGDKLDGVIVASGVLHDSELSAEKSLRELALTKMHKIFAVNCFGPALVLKYFLPLLTRDHRSIFAVLSARVASISDNKLGGWHSYRASKTALNMLIKNAAIEHSRKSKESIIVALHPGTVDSKLSKPFQAGINHEIFSPQNATKKMLNVLEALSGKDSGKFFDYEGIEILP